MRLFRKAKAPTDAVVYRTLRYAIVGAAVRFGQEQTVRFLRSFIELLNSPVSAFYQAIDDQRKEA